MCGLPLIPHYRCLAIEQRAQITSSYLIIQCNVVVARCPSSVELYIPSRLT